MPNAFAPFDYGQVAGNVEAIKGARTRNALAQQQMNPNSPQNQLMQAQLTGAQQGNVLAQQKGQREQTTADEATRLANSEFAYEAFTVMSQNPEAVNYYGPKLKEMGIIPPETDWSNATPEETMSFAEKQSQALGRALGKGQQANIIGKYNPGDFTPESWSKFMQAGGGHQNAGMLERYEAPTVTEVGGVRSIVDRSGQGGQVTPLSTPEAEAKAAGLMSGAQERAKLEQRQDVEPGIARDVALAKKSAEIANKAYESIDKIRENTLNLMDAAELVRGGASTGPLMSRLPSLRANSVALDNMQGRLGLDVVGAVTFGALSKGELDLAKSVALPTGLQGPELVSWIEKKVEAQQKLSKYLEEQANFLSQGGTQAGWRKQLKERKEVVSDLPEGTVDNGDGTFTLPTGQRIRKSNANP